MASCDLFGPSAVPQCDSHALPAGYPNQSQPTSWRALDRIPCGTAKRDPSAEEKMYRIWDDEVALGS
ncbi:hypothetical protein MASR2M8_13220 [Opitutaceae bacterium]